MEKKLDELYELIKDIEIAMFTTRRADGHLVSRPMATQAQAAGADFWFATDIRTAKTDELDFDPNVNLAYYNMKSREYVSVSGEARVVRDRAKIHELWRPDWKAWFEGDGPEAGTADDPNIVVIGVNAGSATYLKIDKPKPVVLFEVARAIVSGDTPELGEVKHVEL
jgi:general stress protein 26